MDNLIAINTLVKNGMSYINAICEIYKINKTSKDSATEQEIQAAVDTTGNGYFSPLKYKSIRNKVRDHFGLTNKTSKELLNGVPYDQIITREKNIAKNKMHKKSKKAAIKQAKDNFIQDLQKLVEECGGIGSKVNNFDRLQHYFNIPRNSNINTTDKNFISKMAWWSLGSENERRGKIDTILNRILRTYTLEYISNLYSAYDKENKHILPKSITKYFNIRGIKNSQNDIDIILNKDHIQITCNFNHITPIVAKDYLNNFIESNKEEIIKFIKSTLQISGFGSFSEWCNIEKDYDVLVKNVLELQYHKKHLKDVENRKQTVINQGIPESDLVDLFKDCNIDNTRINISLLSRYAKTKELLTFKDRNKLYQIKNILLKKALTLSLAEIVELVERDNPYFLSIDNVACESDWCAFSDCFFDSYDEDYIDKGNEKSFFIRHLLKTKSIKLSEGNNKYTLHQITSNSDYYQNSIKYIKDRADKIGVSFLEMYLKLYSYYNIGGQFNCDHLPEFIIDKLNSNYLDDDNIPQQLTDKKYFWLWTIKFDDIYFHVPYSDIKLTEFKGDKNVNHTTESNFKEYGRPISDEEFKNSPIIEVLSHLHVDNLLANFPNNLKTPDQINDDWFNYQKQKQEYIAKYIDFFDDEY